MKKLFLMGAVASLGLLASCSSDDDLSTGGNGKDGLQQIKIGMGVQANVATRGTGTVGAVGEKENTWAKQTVNVYMLNKGTLDLAMFGDDPIYKNAVLTTPNGYDSGIATEFDNDGETPLYKYYPTDKNAFDFWGYRLDDADKTTVENQDGSATAAAIKNNKFVPYINGDSLLIGFNIDGTQDIMAGKAVPTEKEIENCGGVDNIYSAFAARRDVQPNIKFEHLLSRLNFQVLDGKKTETTDPDKAVQVTGITVKSKATGKLVIAYQGEATTFANVSDQLIVDRDADSEKDAALLKELKVKQRESASSPLTDNLVDLKSVTPKWNNGMAMATQVGEALLAIPADKYEITINLQQKVQVKGDKKNPTPDDYQTKVYTYTADLKNTVNPENGFEPGYSYNVTITVYGLSEIQITTTLTPWNDGGNIEMNPEDETFGATTANKDYEWAALDAEPAGATVEATTYESLDSLNAAVAANASNSGKIYKVGSEGSWTYYQCKVKVVTPPAQAATYTFDEYTFQEGDTVEATYGTKEELEGAVTANADTENKIYKVGTDPDVKYYKVTKNVAGA